MYLLKYTGFYKNEEDCDWKLLNIKMPSLEGVYKYITCNEEEPGCDFYYVIVNLLQAIWSRYGDDFIYDEEIAVKFINELSSNYDEYIGEMQYIFDKNDRYSLILNLYKYSIDKAKEEGLDNPLQIHSYAIYKSIYYLLLNVNSNQRVIALYLPIENGTAKLNDFINNYLLDKSKIKFDIPPLEEDTFEEDMINDLRDSMNITMEETNDFLKSLDDSSYPTMRNPKDNRNGNYAVLECKDENGNDVKVSVEIIIRDGKVFTNTEIIN